MTVSSSAHVASRHHHLPVPAGCANMAETRLACQPRAGAHSSQREDSMKDLRTVLAEGTLIFGDGAIGTTLHARGLQAGTMPEAWSETHPEEVKGVHAAYLKAGAQYLTTNTFGASRIRLGEGELGARVAEFNERAVELVRQAAGDRAWIAGSVGPTGKLMQPYGDLSVAEAEDLIVVETHHDSEEAGAAVRMALQLGSVPVFSSFAFNPKGRTMMGLKAADAARGMEALGVSAVGANCGDGPDAVAAALEQMQTVTTLPLLARSNAGIPQLGDNDDTIWDIEADAMARHARHFAELGARVIGGCCGTGPAHIAAIVAALAPGR
jgi:5-methyltetrahydrofolate--homocysteine methyltransferase